MQSLISLRRDFNHRYTANEDHLYLKDEKKHQYLSHSASHVTVY